MSDKVGVSVQQLSRSPWVIGLLEGAQALAITVIGALVLGIAQFVLFQIDYLPAFEVVPNTISIWLLSFAGPAALLGEPFSLPPLLLCALSFLVVHRAGRRTAHALTVNALTAALDAPARRPWEWSKAWGMLSLVLLAALAVFWRASDTPLSPLGLVGARCVLVILAAGLLGVLGRVKLPDEELAPRAKLLDRTVEKVGSTTFDLLRTGVRSAGRVALGLAALGTAGVAAALALGWDELVAVQSVYGLQAGPVVGLALIQIVYLPTMIVWALSWLLGVGFKLGEGTIYSPGVVVDGPLPAVPALAVIPTEPAPWGFAGIAVLVVMGVIIAWRWRAASWPARGWQLAGLGGALLALSLAAFVLATGAIGPGRLAVAGPGSLFPIVATSIVVASCAGTLAIIDFAPGIGGRTGRLRAKLGAGVEAVRESVNSRL